MRPPHTRRLIARLLGLLLLIHSFPTVSRAETMAESISAPLLIIGEINWAGSSRSTADEWVELWNIGDEPISLSGFRLLGAGGANGIVFHDGLVIPPHQTFLIANYDASDPKSALEAPPNVVTTTISLPNDQLALEIRAPDNVLIDQAGTNAAPAAGSSLPRKTSMIRADIQRRGTDPDAWTSATSSIGLDAGTEDDGTPGWCDRCWLPPDPPSTINTDIISTTHATDTAFIVEEIAATTTATLPDLVFIDATTSDTLLTDASATAIFSTSTSTTDESGADISTASTTDFIASPTTMDEVTTSSSSTHSPIFVTSTLASDLISPLFTPRLNEIMAAPADSAEWVELIGVERDDLARLEGWTIEDAVGVIFRFTSTTIRDLTFSPPYLQINLPGHHLNNTGDYVGLRNAERAIVDHATYPKVTSEESWIRLPDASETWRITRRITPANENVFFIGTVAEAPTAPTITPVTTSPPTPSPSAAPSTQLSSSAAKNTSSPAPTTASTKTQTARPTMMHTTPASTTATSSSFELAMVPLTSSASSVIKSAATSPSRTSHTATRSPRSPSRKSMPSTSTTNETTKINATDAARVRITGTIANVAGLLNKNQFVLLADDGRGLLIKGNGQQTTPPYGQHITLTGALVVNDDGAALTMAKRDRWTSAENDSASVLPRHVDLLAPSAEDAWSLVEATGTIRELRKPFAIMETEDALIAIHIRPAIHYRLERLQIGDIVSVRGLLEPGGDEETRILPRNADEIRLVERAHIQTAPPKPADSLPPWTPFGAAGLTVALTQGVRRFKKIQEQRHLQKILEQTENQLTASL